MPKNALRLALFLTFAPLLAGTLMAANLASAPADLVDLLDDNLARAKKPGAL